MFLTYRPILSLLRGTASFRSNRYRLTQGTVEFTAHRIAGWFARSGVM